MDLRHFLLLAVCLVTAFVLWNGLENGLLSRNHVSEPSQCTMTYMYPYFSAISMLKKSRHAPKYELYHFLDESSPSAMVCFPFAQWNEECPCTLHRLTQFIPNTAKEITPVHWHPGSVYPW